MCPLCAAPGLQNGAPDGLALVGPAPDNVVIEFLSYEGAFTAANGAAVGLTSTDIGASEGDATPPAGSLEVRHAFVAVWRWGLDSLGAFDMIDIARVEAACLEC